MLNMRYPIANWLGNSLLRIIAIVYARADKKKNLNSQFAKAICGAVKRSTGVNATPIKQRQPNTPEVVPIIASALLVFVSLNKRQTCMKNNKITTPAPLSPSRNRLLEKKLFSPLIAIVLPISLRKLYFME